MDELLYLFALIAGIVGSVMIWRYARVRKRAVVRAVRKQKKIDEENERS